jgi:hypothetical protein
MALINNHANKQYEWVEAKFHTFLSRALYGSHQLHVAAALTRGRALDVEWIRVYMGPRGGLNFFEKGKKFLSRQKSNLIPQSLSP